MSVITSPTLLFVLLLIASLSFNTRGYRVRALQEYQEESSTNLKQQVFVLRARATKRDQQIATLRKQADMANPNPNTGPTLTRTRTRTRTRTLSLTVTQPGGHGPKLARARE